MSADSRRTRQRRAVLARYLAPSLLESMLGVTRADVDAWVAGDTRVATAHTAAGPVFGCFEYAARTFGLDDAQEWFATDNAGLGGATPATALRERRGGGVLPAAKADSPFDWVPMVALDRAGTPRVALAGDWHGNLGFALGSIERLAKLGIRTLLHLGDFSLWPGPLGAKFIRRITKACDEHDITIYVTDSNHEDHARLALSDPPTACGGSPTGLGTSSGDTAGTGTTHGSSVSVAHPL